MKLFDKLYDSKTEKTLVITTSTRWESFVRFGKYLCIFIISSIIIYFLYLSFGGFVFGSFLFTFIMSSAILLKTIDVPHEYFLECRIEVKKDNEGNIKSSNFILNEYKIPVELLKGFKLEGDTTTKWKSKSGKVRSVVEKIDFTKKIIYYCWFSKISDWEFMVLRNTFYLCKDALEEQNKNLLVSEHTRELYYQLELSKMYRLLNKDSSKDKILEEFEKTLKENINKIWSNVKN